MKKAMITLLIIAIAGSIFGCRATRAYKVTFENGDTDYYELNYKPKPGAKTINVEGEEIFGVKSIERL